MTAQLMFLFEESLANLHQDVPDQAYVDGLIELAYACAETDVLRSLSLAQEAVSAAGALNYARGRAAGLICIGHAQLTLGQIGRASCRERV